jgi:hypothetical protein
MYIFSAGHRKMAKHFPLMEMPMLNTRIGINPPTTATTADTSLGVATALNGMKRVGTGMEVVTTLIAFSHCGMLVGALLFEWTWFQSWHTYRFLIPLLLDVLILKFVHSCWMHNLSNIFTLHNLILVIWLLGLWAMTIWALVDVFWFCPTEKPNYCTDMVDSTIEPGFWVYCAFLWFTTLLYTVEIALMAMAARYTRRLSQIMSMTEGDLQAMLLDALRGKTTSYVRGIGSKFN